MLSRVFFIAVPFYVAANVKDTVTLRNCIYIGILMTISIALYGYYKKNGTKEITLYFETTKHRSSKDDSSLLDQYSFYLIIHSVMFRSSFTLKAIPTFTTFLPLRANASA